MLFISNEDKQLAETTALTIHRFLVRNNTDEKLTTIIKNIGILPLTEEKCTQALSFLQSEGLPITPGQIVLIKSKISHFETIETETTSINNENLQHNSQILVVSLTAKKALEKYQKFLRHQKEYSCFPFFEEKEEGWKLQCFIL